MKEQENNLTISEGVESLLNLSERKMKKFTTITPEDEDSKMMLYNALQQCDILINDIKGQVIEFDNIYVEAKEVDKENDKGEKIINEVTGEVETKTAFRTILFGIDGKTYVSSAYGVYNSIRSIISIFGLPSKENPIKVKVSEKEMSKSKFKSLILIVTK